MVNRRLAPHYQTQPIRVFGAIIRAIRPYNAVPKVKNNTYIYIRQLPRGAYFEADKLSVDCPSVVPSRSATSVLPSSLFLKRRIVAGEDLARLSTMLDERRKEELKVGLVGQLITTIQPCSEIPAQSSFHPAPHVPSNSAAGQSLLAALPRSGNSQ